MNETNISLFPPAGAAAQTIKTPQGDVQAFVPAMEYTKVKDVNVNWNDGKLSFTTRTGDQIQTNLPYIIRHTKPQEQNQA